MPYNSSLKAIKKIYYIRLYFTIFLLARSNTHDIPFSNILISKMQFLCNKKSYCTLVQNQWMKLLSPSHLVTPIQYTKKKVKTFQNFIKFQNFKESYVIKQLLHLNEINMRFYGAEYNNIEQAIIIFKQYERTTATWNQSVLRCVIGE